MPHQPSTSRTQTQTQTQKRRKRRLRLKRSISEAQRVNPTDPPSYSSPTATTSSHVKIGSSPIPRMISTLKTFQNSTSTSTLNSPNSNFRRSTSQTSISPFSNPQSPRTPRTPRTPQSTPQKTRTTNHVSSPTTSNHSIRSSTTSIVDTVEGLLDGEATHNILSNFDLEVDMLASRAFARDGNNEPFITSPKTNLDLDLDAMRPPRIIIDDYLEDVSLTSPSSRSGGTLKGCNTGGGGGGSSIDDHYELVVLPQLEIILDAVRSVQHEIHHLRNEFLDMKVSTRYALKKIWSYLNFSVDDTEEGY